MDATAPFCYEKDKTLWRLPKPNVSDGGKLNPLTPLFGREYIFDVESVNLLCDGTVHVEPKQWCNNHARAEGV